MNINTLRKVLVTLGQILSYAARHRYIAQNPLRDTERPKKQGREGEHKQEKITILTPSQLKAFLEKIVRAKISNHVHACSLWRISTR